MEAQKTPVSANNLHKEFKKATFGFFVENLKE